MNARDFLSLARRLATDLAEAAWRSAVSRAYYAAFHVAQELLEDFSFRVPRTEQAHKYLAHRLSNCGDAQVQRAGSDLDILRDLRNQADYDLRRPVAQELWWHACNSPNASSRSSMLQRSSRHAAKLLTP